jgi:hypothetical protein
MSMDEHAVIADLRERVAELEERLDEDDADTRTATRRGVLATAATAAGIGALGGRARAATPDGYLGSGSDPLGIYLADARKPDNGDPVQLPATLLKDEAADPSANGELQRNGSDVKVYSGGSVVNLSNISGGALTDSGTDTADGNGDLYELPQADDGINLPSGPLNAQSVSITGAQNEVHSSSDPADNPSLFSNGDKATIQVNHQQNLQDESGADTGGNHLYGIGVFSDAGAESTNAINVVMRGGEAGIGVAAQGGDAEHCIMATSASRNSSTPSGEVIRAKHEGGHAALGVYATDFAVNRPSNTMKFNVDATNDQGLARYAFTADATPGSGSDVKNFDIRRLDGDGYTSIHIRGTEVMRLNDDGSVDVSGAVNGTAF